MKQKLLLTGSRGSLGRSLRSSRAFEDLNRDFEIVCWDTSLHGSLTDATVLTKSIDNIQPEIVVHLAWMATSTPDYDLNAGNLMWGTSTELLAQIVADSGAWFIGTGSIIEEYSSISTPYKESKVQTRNRVLNYNSSSSWLRPSWILNPDEGRPRLIGDYLRARQKGEQFNLKNPLKQHDFMSIADFSGALRTVLNFRLAGVQDIGMGMPHTVLDALESVDRHARDHLIFEPFAGNTIAEPAEYLADNRRLLTAGWKPLESLHLFSGAREFRSQ